MEKQSDQCKVRAATENWQTEQKNSCHSCRGTLYRMHDKECLAAARGAVAQISSLLYGHCSEFNLQWESISVWRPEIKHKVDCSAQPIFSIIKSAKNDRSNWVVFLSITIERNENSFATFCHRLCWSSAAAGTINRNAISPPGPPACTFTQSLSDLCWQ